MRKNRIRKWNENIKKKVLKCLYSDAMLIKMNNTKPQLLTKWGFNVDNSGVTFLSHYGTVPFFFILLGKTVLCLPVCFPGERLKNETLHKGSTLKGKNLLPTHTHH